MLVRKVVWRSLSRERLLDVLSSDRPPGALAQKLAEFRAARARPRSFSMSWRRPHRNSTIWRPNTRLCRSARRRRTVTCWDGFAVGRTIYRGRYTLLKRAHDTVENRDVVLKLPLPAMAQDPVFNAGFLREAWIGSQMRSRWSVDYLDLPKDRRSCLYLVMPYYRGVTLEERLKTTPPVALTEGNRRDRRQSLRSRRGSLGAAGDASRHQAGKHLSAHVGRSEIARSRFGGAAGGPRRRARRPRRHHALHGAGIVQGRGGGSAQRGVFARGDALPHVQRRRFSVRRGHGIPGRWRARGPICRPGSARPSGRRSRPIPRGASPTPQNCAVRWNMASPMTIGADLRRRGAATKNLATDRHGPRDLLPCARLVETLR